jgi:hypothetical protein
MAASAQYEVTTNYLLQEDGTADVELNLTGNNVTEDTTPPKVILPLVGINPTQIEAKYEDGTAIETEVGQEGKTVILQTNENNTDGKPWKLTLTYKTELAKRYGTTTIYDVPGQGYGDLEISKETVAIQSVPELSGGVPRGFEPEIKEISLGNEVMTWVSADGPLNESVGVLYGDKSLAKYTFATKLENTSWWWADKEVVLPPDTNQQSVVLSSIEPKPKELRLDQDGNIIATYSLRPRQSVDVKAQGEIFISNYSYALGGSSGLSNIPAELKDNYTQTNEVWNGDQVDSDVSADLPVSKMVEEIFSATVEKIPGEAKGVDEAQKWSNALVGELRSAGIPARLILGQAYTDGLMSIDPPQAFAWVEAYVPATGWITLDPMTERSMQLFGSADVERVALVMRGSDPGYPPENLESFKLDWQADLGQEPSPSVPTIKSTSNMILPGISILSVQVAMGPGTIVDDAAIDVPSQGLIKLGSLAPLETSTTSLPAVGGAAFAQDKVTYGVLENDAISQVQAEAVTTINYIPMILIIVSITLLIVLIVVFKKRSAKNSSSKSNKSKIRFADDDNGLSIDSFDFDDDFDEPEAQAQEPEQSNHTVASAPEKKAEPAVPTPIQPKGVTINSQAMNRNGGKRSKPPRLIQ